MSIAATSRRARSIVRQSVTNHMRRASSVMDVMGRLSEWDALPNNLSVFRHAKLLAFRVGHRLIESGRVRTWE